MKKRPTLADARLAALKLLLLPERYEQANEVERDFLRSDIVGQLLNGDWPAAFPWLSNTRKIKWTTKATTKPQ